MIMYANSIRRVMGTALAGARTQLFAVGQRSFSFEFPYFRYSFARVLLPFRNKRCRVNFQMKYVVFLRNVPSKVSLSNIPSRVIDKVKSHVLIQHNFSKG